MSLKSKLEAVIYAAEEPVTLTQLATLFASDALEWKEAQEASTSQANAAPEPDKPSLAEGLEYLDLHAEDQALLQPQDASSDLEHAADTGRPEPADIESAHSESKEAATASTEPGTEPTPETAEADAKREARQRDRDVKAVLRQLIDEIIVSCASDDRGVEIREIAGGYRMATKPECHDAVRMFIKSQKPPLRLSLPALETLAVIAYKQPVTAPEVNEIRGVDSSGVFGSLMARKLITTAGRKQVIGRPILYKTTKEFLLRFGLNDVSELPSMDEFEKMAAIELDEADAGTTTETGATAAYDAGAPGGGPELDENAPEEPDQAEEMLPVAKRSSSAENESDAGTDAQEDESNQTMGKVE